MRPQASGSGPIQSTSCLTVTTASLSDRKPAPFLSKACHRLGPASSGKVSRFCVIHTSSIVKFVAKGRFGHMSHMADNDTFDLAVPQTQTWSYLEALNPLLTTNDPPSESEELLARAEIARAQQHLDIIQNAGVLKVQQILDSLKESRQKVDMFVQDHKRILSPLRHANLPSEVLAEIFCFIADGLRLNAVYNENGMWVIAQVCRYWRHLSLSLPSLWSRISIARDSVPSGVELLLSRSEGAMLDVRIDDLTSQLDDDGPFRAIFAVSHRWRVVHIHTLTREPPLLKIKGHVPLLEFVYLSQTPSSPFAYFSEAPLLKTIVIDSNLDHYSLATLQLPWSQIRECCLPSSLPLDHFNVLQSCPNIEVLQLISDYKHPDPFPMPADILMPKLQNLFIYIHNELLNHLILPSLACLILRYSQWDDQYIERLRRLLGWSSFCLGRLELEKCWDGDLICAVRILREVPFPNLTCLLLDCDMSSHSEFPGLLTVLTIGADSTQCILPRLQRLRMRSTGFLRTYMDKEDVGCVKECFLFLIAMVRSRCESETTSRLTCLELDLALTEASSLAGGLEPLLALRDQGLKLEMDSFYLYPQNGGLDNSELGRPASSNHLEGPYP